MPLVRADLVFDLELAHGRCVGLRIPPDDTAVHALAEEMLLLEERAFAATLARLRLRTWLVGRAALRVALARAGLACPTALLADDRGAPRTPGDLLASVSHKESVAVALVAPADGTARIGVDVEDDRARKHDIARRVLTEAEQSEIAGLPDRDRAREVTVRFSAKEAIYKAIDPFVRRYVGFHEVAVTPLPGGDARVTPMLRPDEGPFDVAATWRKLDGMILTTARVTSGRQTQEERKGGRD
jgi:4'-phosphopantetheinyl transferase EntD